MRQFLRGIMAWLRGLPSSVTAGLVVLVVLGAGTAIILQSEASYREQKSEEAQVQAEILAASIVARKRGALLTPARSGVGFGIGWPSARIASIQPPSWRSRTMISHRAGG